MPPYFQFVVLVAQLLFSLQIFMIKMLYSFKWCHVHKKTKHINFYKTVNKNIQTLTFVKYIQKMLSLNAMNYELLGTKWKNNIWNICLSCSK